MRYFEWILAAREKRKLEKTTNTQRKARGGGIGNMDGVGWQWAISMQTGIEF